MTKKQNRKSLYEGFLKSYFGNIEYQHRAITSDASFRCYSRVVSGEHSYILMDSDPDKLDNQPFVALNSCFAQGGLRVPSILHADMDNGLMLLEDLGSEHLADRLSTTTRQQDYLEIIALLANIASTPVSEFMKPYDAEFIGMELDIFWQWLVCDWLELDESSLPVEQWLLLKKQLVDAMLAQPQVTMHRDFHSRNIMNVSGEWALIDYQDAVQGPVTYDAVSLLRDCYFKLPQDEFNVLQKASFVVLRDANLLAGMTFEQYSRYFDLTGMQRHLKAAGIFCRLLLRDGKSGYLQNILPTLDYIHDVAKCYESFQWLATWIRHDIMPKVEAKLSSLTV
ncbi:aminoglycoside phosphotransferase family protein [Pseudoalteromonas sp. T1lg23B]|uniref:aminoglycoside phosphotransferase family protein n=1 Tax=Pseudoalteromonas sp. T1lg23B TaxID=2077097 RepID=UPI001F1ED17F|nr:phosphotransferase [Pseudoalteromonas sp. T1lg23B]